MEWSAMVYILLTALTVALGLCVDNREYVPDYIRGGRRYLSWSGGDGGNGLWERRRARNGVAMAAIYCLLTGVSACRIAVGNDYWVYRDNFNLIAQDRHVASEFGFNMIVRWIQGWFGHDKYVPVFAFFSIVTVWFFMRALHDQGSHFAFSLYLLMTGGYYFNSLNSVRYYLALAMALFSMKYVLRGEYGKFILTILAGAMFHKSILLVIPVYLAARFLAAARLKKWHYLAGTAFLCSLIFGQSLYREIIFIFYPFYRDSAFDNGQLSYANILKCGCVLLLGLICYRQSLRENIVNRFYFFLNLLGLTVYCCGSFIPEVSRVGYYMIVSQVFLVPALLEEMPWRRLRKLCYVGVIGAFGCYFLLLLKGMYAIDVRLLPYLNWIFDDTGAIGAL